MPVNLDFIEPLPASTNLDFGTEWQPPLPGKRRLTWQGANSWGALNPLPPQWIAWARTPAGKQAALAASWGTALFSVAETQSRWRDLPKLPLPITLPWGTLLPVKSEPSSVWKKPPRKPAQTLLPWGEPGQLETDVSASYRYPAVKREICAIQFQALVSRNRHGAIPWGHLTWRAKRYETPWNQGHAPARIWPPPVIVPPDPPPPVVCDYQPIPGHVVNLDFSEPLPGDTRLEFWCHAPERHIVTRTLIMLPTASIVRLPNREPLEAASVQIDLDIDSWAWNLRATVPAASLALIMPDSGGPAEIEITLSGHVWKILVEGFEESRQFGSAAYSVHGRSSAAILAAPYAPARTWTQNNERTSRQLADEELLNTGWSINWDTSTPDWLIPGGVFSYDNLTPMDAIGKIAASVGSVILPSMASKVLTIQPRYRFNVWSLDGSANNAVLDPSILTGLSLQWAPQPKYNGVYTSGQSQGVAVFTKRAGTAGELQAQMAVDPLLTTPAAGLERGRQILNSSGNKARVSVSLPLTSHGTLPGLMQPGYVVEVLESTPWKGYVTAVSISAEMHDDGPAFTQQLEIERHYE